MASRTSKTSQLLKDDSELIWHPFSKQVGGLPVLEVTSAHGVFLETNEGRLIDAVSSWWVNLHGHGRKEIAEAIAKQAKVLEQVIFAGFTHEPAVMLAKTLLPLVPGNGAMKKLFFSDNGSTAVEVAIKLGLQYWYNRGKKRLKILAFEGAYHGDTFGAMSVAGPSLFNKPFADLFFEVLTIPYPEKGKKTNAAKITKKLLEAHPDCALLVYEPMVQGSAGMRMADPKELSLILKSVRTSSALLIADEVMTGFGRTGTLFASEQLSVKPDLVCMSKGITGGFLPMGATAVNTKVFEAFASSDSGKTFYHGHSYTASPLACAAANASLKLLLTKSCEKDRLRINRSHIDFSQKLKTHPLVENVRTCGTIFAFEVRQIKNDYLSRIRDPLYLSFIKKGVLLRPLGNTVYILTPYTISDKEIKTVYQAIEKTLDEMLEANR